MFNYLAHPFSSVRSWQPIFDDYNDDYIDDHLTTSSSVEPRKGKTAEQTADERALSEEQNCQDYYTQQRPQQ